MSLQLQIDRLIASQPAPVDLKLQLGCGQNYLPGWINTDGEPGPVGDYLDFTRRFPFPDSTLAAVLCEHTIEHVSRENAIGMIGEVHRTLRPGGAFRVVTPCLETFCRMVLEPQSPAAQTYLAWFRGYTRNAQANFADAINLCFYGHGHRHIYGRDELCELLLAAGFQEVRILPAGTHGHPVFAGADGHGKIVGAEIAAIEAMAVEAVKRRA